MEVAAVGDSPLPSRLRRASGRRLVPLCGAQAAIGSFRYSYLPPAVPATILSLVRPTFMILHRTLIIPRGSPPEYETGRDRHRRPLYSALGQTEPRRQIG